MDVLKPDLLTIDGIRYRLNPGNHGYIGNRIDEQPFEQCDDVVIFDKLSDGEEDIEESEGGRFTSNFHIPKIYFPYIIGSKGGTKKRLEYETHSKISIPKQGHDGDIVVTAATKKSVASARRRIRMMVCSSRKRQALTHFLSIPLNQPRFVDGFLSFKEKVLQKCGNDRGVKDEIFQYPGRLHLTIGVLVLSDETERNEASSVLQECNDIVVKPLLEDKKLRIVMNGIEIMNDDPEEVSVLYGKVTFYQNLELLQEIVDAINMFFSKKGLLQRNKIPVKLHATLMNTHFASEKESQTNDRKLPKDTFDARNIIENFHDYYFGDDIVSTIELSVKSSSSAKTNYYPATSKITL